MIVLSISIEGRLFIFAPVNWVVIGSSNGLSHASCLAVICYWSPLPPIGSSLHHYHFLRYIDSLTQYWGNSIELSHPYKPTDFIHYDDIIMSAMAPQITSLTFVYSSVYSGADHRKHQSPTSLAFVRVIHRWPVNSPHKWPVTRKIFPFDDVIMHLRSSSHNQFGYVAQLAKQSYEYSKDVDGSTQDLGNYV